MLYGSYISNICCYMGAQQHFASSNYSSDLKIVIVLVADNQLTRSCTFCTTSFPSWDLASATTLLLT